MRRPPARWRSPFGLDGLTIDVIGASATIDPPGYLTTTLDPFNEYLAVTLPPGTRAVGLWVAGFGPLVTMIDAAGGGPAAAGAPPDGSRVFIGFTSPVDIRAIRIWKPSTATISGFPIPIPVSLGDILTRR